MAGDGDHEPPVRKLASGGLHVTVLHWAHASRNLREAASAFHALDECIAGLALVWTAETGEGAAGPPPLFERRAGTARDLGQAPEAESRHA